MLGKNFKFKELDFSGQYQKTLQSQSGYSYPLQDESNETTINTAVAENTNYHGGVISNSILGIRYFNFRGKAIGMDKTKRGIVWELLQKNLITVPDVNGSEYFNLNWETDHGEKRTCKVKVQMPIEKDSHEMDSPVIDFSFQLACPSEKIYSDERKSAQIGIGIFGGHTIPYTIPYTIGGYAGYAILNNEGNRHAPIEIKIVGKCTNPKIINITNKQKFRLDYTTNNLIFSNLNEDFSPNSLVVEDLCIDIRKHRLSGNQIFLSPGINHLVVLTDDPTETAQVYIKFRDTFNY